ncbi:hypothetical protein GUJ93_ZPchr0006g42479, partial [Zizania palustris]
MLRCRGCWRCSEEKGVPKTTLKQSGHAYFPVANGYMQQANAREADMLIQILSIVYAILGRIR